MGKSGWLTGTWIKPCPECGIDIKYINNGNYHRSIKLNWKCVDCKIKQKIIDKENNKNKYVRTCPNPTNNKRCRKKMRYSNIYNFRNAEKDEKLCLSCSGIAGGVAGTATKHRTGNWGTETKRKNGSLKHTENAKQKISKTLKENYDSGKVIVWNSGLTALTDERVAKTGKSRPGKLNPNYNLGFYKVWIKKYGQKRADEMNKIRIQNMVETNVNMPYLEWLKILTNKERYYHDVKIITNTQPIHLLENHNKRGRCDINPDAYHLDHIISIDYGFKNNISSKKIGNISNLRFIPWLENVKKGNKND